MWDGHIKLELRLMIGRQSWQLELTDEFELVEEEDNSIDTVWFSEGQGVVQFSSFISDTPVLIDDLLEFAFGGDAPDDQMKHQALGDLSGLVFEENPDELLTVHWYLKSFTTMLYVTFICSKDNPQIERSGVFKLLSGVVAKLSVEQEYLNKWSP